MSLLHLTFYSYYRSHVLSASHVHGAVLLQPLIDASPPSQRGGNGGISCGGTRGIFSNFLFSPATSSTPLLAVSFTPNQSKQLLQHLGGQRRGFAPFTKLAAYVKRPPPPEHDVPDVTTHFTAYGKTKISKQISQSN